MPPFPPDPPSPKTAVSHVSSLKVHFPESFTASSLLGQRYFISFIISLSQSQLFKPRSCRFVKVCGVMPQPSGFPHQVQGSLTYLVNPSESFQRHPSPAVMCLALGVEPGKPRVLQSSPWLCHVFLQESSDSFSKEKAFVSKMLNLTSAPKKCFQPVAAEVF